MTYRIHTQDTLGDTPSIILRASPYALQRIDAIKHGKLNMTTPQHSCVQRCASLIWLYCTTLCKQQIDVCVTC